jgi:hypothetical protein
MVLVLDIDIYEKPTIFDFKKKKKKKKTRWTKNLLRLLKNI